MNEAKVALDDQNEDAPGDPGLPDPSRPPRNRGSRSRASITNVDVTELVKGRIGTQTRPWQK